MAARGYSNEAAKAKVYWSGQLVESIFLASVNVATGGRSLASARFSLNLTNGLATNAASYLSFASVDPIDSEIEIAIESRTGQAGSEQVIFWGTISGKGGEFGGDSDSITFDANQAPRHYGKYVTGMHEHNASAKGLDFPILQQPLVFNPTVNFTSYTGKRVPGARDAGMVRGNMNDTHKYGRGKCNVFLDPGSVFTPAARRFALAASEKRATNKQDAQMLASDKKWTLREAAYYLCWTLNEDETNFKNPTRGDLKILDDSPELLQEVTIPLGVFLPEALDMLLTPYGYTWRVQYRRRGARVIRFHKRGSGPRKVVKHQQFGESFIPDETNLASLELACGNRATVNRIEALGDFRLYESTFELRKAWTDADDDLYGTDLLWDGAPDWLQRPQHHRVWRDWVLNEAGDYNGLRPEIRAPHDLSAIFTKTTVPRRRRFVPCITLDKDRLPVGGHGYLVQYHDGAGDPSDDATWRAINGYEILTSECGIRFTGPTPPVELAGIGPTVKVRITASIYSDERLTFSFTSNNSPLAPEISPVLLNVSDRFHFREVHKDSIFFDEIKAGRYEHSQVDDTNEMGQFIFKLLDSVDCFDLRGTAVISDLDGDKYELGDALTEVAGRGISLETKTSGKFKRYAEIVGITYDYVNQKRILALETFRDASYR